MQIALSSLVGFGNKKTRSLLSSVDTLDDIFKLSYAELSKKSGFSSAHLKDMKRSEALSKAKEMEEFVLKNKIEVISIDQSQYPRRLKQCDDAPVILYYKGEIDLNPDRTLAVVGTRNATDYGKRVCEELIKGLADKNITVISGLAYGIDIHIHQLCLKYNVPTIAILAHGLDRIYPSVHRSTAQKMTLNGGLMTEFDPFTNPDRENFPKRNRIVAGLSDATLVIESKNRGGSLITAELANGYNRDVFAVPGNIHQEYSYGCNQLIADSKAHLYKNYTSFLKWMSWNNTDSIKPDQIMMPTGLSDQQTHLVTLLQSEGAQHIDMLSMKTKLPISQTSVELFHLELNGIIRSLPGNRFALLV
ncbi:MAG: DNA processing protein [Lentimonas sp.]|jgi:DNA processing protein